MPEATAKIGRCTICQNSQFSASARLRDPLAGSAEFIRQVEQDRAGFEHASRRALAIVMSAGILEFGSPDKSATKLVALTDPDEPSRHSPLRYDRQPAIPPA